MIFRAIIPLLFGLSAALQSAPECAETVQEYELLLSICRSVPELESLSKTHAFSSCECREIAPGYYLLCADIGSGAYVYHFALVKQNPADNTWQLIDNNIISSAQPKKYIHNEVKGGRYKVEILLAPNNWVSVFSGTLSTPPPTFHE